VLTLCKRSTFFSEGDPNDFQTIVDTCVALRIECAWHLDAPVRAVHYSLSIADILVIARSSFSGSAAFLNQGKVFSDTELVPSESGRLNIKPLDVQAIWEHAGADFRTESAGSKIIMCYD